MKKFLETIKRLQIVDGKVENRKNIKMLTAYEQLGKLASKGRSRKSTIYLEDSVEEVKTDTELCENYNRVGLSTRRAEYQNGNSIITHKIYLLDKMVRVEYYTNDRKVIEYRFDSNMDAEDAYVDLFNGEVIDIEETKEISLIQNLLESNYGIIVSSDVVYDDLEEILKSDESVSNLGLYDILSEVRFELASNNLK